MSHEQIPTHLDLQTMIFNSLEYLVFLPIVLIVYFRLTHKQQNLWLLLASYLFYGWWDPRFLFLISMSTAIDFFCGKLLVQREISKQDKFTGVAYLLVSCIVFLGAFSNQSLENSISLIGLGIFFIIFVTASLVVFPKLRFRDEINKRRAILTVSICTNLGLLAFFKYFNFFIDSAESALLQLGMSQASLLHLDIILPVGISFYTFQTMSYTIDIYRGKLKPCQSFLDFALFVSFFPQLVAGPIERATNLLPKIVKPRQFSGSQAFMGIGLICYGLFKKVVIADGVAGSVASVYGTSGEVSGIDVLAATLLFTFQIYCDFSGYSDIARGTSKLLGIDLMRNFRFPYFSRNPSEFWNRWHISLSSWLRDYLYISLGGNRVSNFKVYRNLMLTMILGGLWHGAAWNFVLWGFYQGALLCFYRAFVPGFTHIAGRFTSSAAFLIGLVIFFLFTMYGWLLFRAESLAQVTQFTTLVFTDLTNFSLSIKTPPLSALLGLPIFMYMELRGYISDRKLDDEAISYPTKSLSLVSRSMLYGTMVFIFVAALSTPPAEFIYFQF